MQASNADLLLVVLAKNTVLQYFNYSISGSLSNAEHLDQNGLFIGNHIIQSRKLLMFCQLYTKVYVVALLKQIQILLTDAYA